MAINESDMTVVYQGPVLHGPEGTAEHIKRTQRVFPKARYILSTWDRSDCRGIDVDQIVLSNDPGWLPGIKRRDGATEPNNINRQLRSTGQGLAAVDTPYAIKIRTDCSLEHARLLREVDRFRIAQPVPRIVASSIFTVDPEMFEHMPYHVSDWVQFGETSALQTYWSAPFMDQQDATYYERHPYAHHSTFMDRRLRCRLAVEQYLASRYAEQLGYAVPRYHNDMRDEVLTDHQRFLAERVVILDPWDMGLRFPKYAWAYQSSFQRLNCLLFPDWYQLYLEQGSAPIETGAPLDSYRTRRKQKQVARAMSRLMDKAGPLLVRPSVKRVVNCLLAFLK